MIKSMTGYGYGEAAGTDYSFRLEIKSVNHRFCEIAVRLPRQFASLEEMIKKQLQTRVNRGKIDVFFNYEETGSKKNTLKVDNELALVYYNSLLALAESCGVAAEVKLTDLAAFPGVLTQTKEDDDPEAINALVLTALTAAIDSFIAMRVQEGRELAFDLEKRLGAIASVIEEISQHAQAVVADYKDKLKLRIEELLACIPVDEARLANEIAFFADKADISEEITRILSHQSQFMLALKADEPIGRKLEFILQEMNREINTIGSKSNGLALSQMVIEVKSELEKIREQIQNIE